MLGEVKSTLLLMVLIRPMAMWIIFLMRIRPSASNTWAGMYLNLNIKQVFDQSVFVRCVQLPKEQ